MKTKEFIFPLILVLLFFTGIIIGDKNIIRNEVYNSWGDIIKILAIFILILKQTIEIVILKERIKKLEDKC